MASMAASFITPVAARMGSASTSRKSSFTGPTRALTVAKPVKAVARQSLSVSANAAERPLWLTGATPPAYLDGSIPGDYGFDPLGLGSDPERLKWYTEAELMHGRWAMMGALGIVGPAALGVEVNWFDAGSVEYDIPTAPLVALEFALLGFLETKRFAGYQKTGKCGLIDTFPWDPLNMGNEAMALKEVKNGRLAMVATFGFFVQAICTRQSPVQDLEKHLASPFENNILTSITHLPETLAGLQ